MSQRECLSKFQHNFVKTSKLKKKAKKKPLIPQVKRKTKTNKNKQNTT